MLVVGVRSGENCGKGPLIDVHGLVRKARARARRVRRGNRPSASTFARFSAASIRSSPRPPGRRRSIPAGCASRPTGWPPAKFLIEESDRIARRWNIYRSLRIAIALKGAMRPAPIRLGLMPSLRRWRFWATAHRLRLCVLRPRFQSRCLTLRRLCRLSYSNFRAENT